MRRKRDRQGLFSEYLAGQLFAERRQPYEKIIRAACTNVMAPLSSAALSEAP